MNSLKNKVQLIGFLGGDPEVKDLNKNKVCNFSVATNETYTDKTGKKITSTQWHRVTAWGKLAGIGQNYLRKGKQVAVEGKLSYRTYDDKNGNKQFITEIIAHDIMLLGSDKQS